MNKILKNQKGFGAVEGLLIVVIIVIIGAVGVFVLSNKDDNKTKQTYTNQSDQSTSSKTATDDTPSSNEYLELNEWNVKLKNIEADKMTYEYKSVPGVDKYDNKFDTSIVPLIQSKNLEDKSCTPGFMLYRSVIEPKIVDDVKIGDNYYWSDGGPGPCSDNPETNPDDILKKSIIRDFSTEKLEAL